MRRGHAVCEGSVPPINMDKQKTEKEANRRRIL